MNRTLQPNDQCNLIIVKQSLYRNKLFDIYSNHANWVYTGKRCVNTDPFLHHIYTIGLYTV